MKLINIIALLTALITGASATETSYTPRKLVIEFGQSTFLNLPSLSQEEQFFSPQGYAAYLYRVGWISGDHLASWMGAFTGYERGGDLGALSYGLTIQHMLSKRERFRPWLGYGLGVSQVWFDSRSGRISGHQTSLRAGLEHRWSSRIDLVFDFGYQLFILPQFESAHSFNTWSTRAGIALRLDSPGGTRE